MPIYEFYCEQCHTVYKFFSRSVNTEKIPNCPVCKNVRLKREISLFAAVTRKKGEQGEADMPDLDESKIAKAMSMLEKEAEKVNEDDPRQAANLMRKLSEATGMKLGPGMEEALGRLEQGGDPETIEQEMGDLLEGDEPFLLTGKKKSGTRPGPKVDETLYEL